MIVRYSCKANGMIAAPLSVAVGAFQIEGFIELSTSS